MHRLAARGSAVALAFAFGFAFAVVACGLFPNVDGLTGGAATSDGGVGDGSAFDDGARPLDAAADAQAPCPSAGRGPDMVRVGAFCIDSTEVTTADYAAFLADGGAPASGMPAECTGNDVTPNTSGGGLFDPNGHAKLPVNSVDWCDAFAFCIWAGKRLCTDTEWRFACSHGGERVFPYGASYDGTAGCNGADAALAATPLLVDVGSRTNCQGGFAGVFDMSGNVWEWIDSCQACDAGSGLCCRHIGGGYGNSPPNLQCTPPNEGAVLDDPAAHDLSIGFRCCGG